MSVDSALWRQWAQPFVLVIASPEVDRICMKNHLTFAEMLKPLGISLDGLGGTPARSPEIC